jgi:hypothetical protein
MSAGNRIRAATPAGFTSSRCRAVTAARTAQRWARQRPRHDVPTAVRLRVGTTEFVVLSGGGASPGVHRNRRSLDIGDLIKRHWPHTWTSAPRDRKPAMRAVQGLNRSTRRLRPLVLAVAAVASLLGCLPPENTAPTVRRTWGRSSQVC